MNAGSAIADLPMKAYADYEGQLTRRHLGFGCLLVMVLMPAGVILDRNVYPPGDFPGLAAYFWRLRLICSVLAAAVWVFLYYINRPKLHRWIGLLIAMLPAAFICQMIYAADGVESPYYAGLNLILLAIAFILRWSVDLSLVASVLVLGMYLVACTMHGDIADHPGILANNLYFMVLTSLIVIVGSRLHRTLRIREFALRFELDQSKQQVEHSNQKLSEQNQVLADTNEKLEDTIEKLKRAEAELVQKEKMASWGVASAGMMHEIKTPLGSTSNGLIAAEREVKTIAEAQRPQWERILRVIGSGITKVNSIIAKFETLARPAGTRVEKLMVEKIVTAALALPNGTTHREVVIHKDFTAAPEIWADAEKLTQVLRHLLSNSHHALQQKQFAGDPPAIWIRTAAQPGSVTLSVRDNGPGIRREDQSKVFDPFFTTKDVGQGMGWGLTICYRFVQDIGGRIHLNSEPGQFCEITLEFPNRS